MSQHDYVIDNQSFPDIRTDLNSAFAAIASNNQGTSAPSTLYSGQTWLDTSGGSSAWLLKIYDGADSIPVYGIDTTTNEVYLPNLQTLNASGSATIGGSVTITDASFDSLHISGDSSNAVGMKISNAYAGAHNYLITSSGGGPAAVGSLVIYDDTAGATRLIVDPSGHLLPGSDNSIDLGSATSEFKDGYFDGVVYVDSIAMPTTTVTDILDEDALTSNSATALATQQSIKAYVDSGTSTLTNKTITSPDINGGTIDGASVGSTTPGSGAFTTLSANGSVTITDASFDSLHISGDSSNAVGMKISNAYAGAHNYLITSSGGGPAAVGSLVIYDDTAGATRLIVDPSGHLLPGSDNTVNLGAGSARMSTIYAGTGTINTSDLDAKMGVRPLTEAEIAVSKAIAPLIKSFKFKSAVAEKGEAARTHIGVIAQEVRDAFLVEGLDGTQYGLLCYDEWGESVQTVDGEVTVIPAGAIWGVRYEELLAFVVAGQEARLAALEAKC